MPEQPAGLAEQDESELGTDVATQPEDKHPSELVGEPADAPEDAGRPEGVAP